MPSAKQNLLDRLANNRLLNSLRVGVDAAVMAYRQEDFVPAIDYGWDKYEARLARYHYNSFYVHNNIYSQVNRYSDWYKHKEGLYKHIRGLRNPIARLVNIEVSKIFGGFINYETFKDGALPIMGADERLLEAIRTVWQWSNMDALKRAYPYEGSSKGDSALIVIDDTRRQKVYLEVLDPCKVKDVEFDNLGNVKSIYICYTKTDDKGKDYEFGYYIDKEKFATFKNGEPYAYMEDESGNGLAEWPNPYGFVPVEWTQHRNLGLKFGAVSFQDSRSKIDNLNDLVSLVHDNVRKNVLTKYAVKGMNPETNSSGTPPIISLGSDQRDQSPMLSLGDNGDIFPIRSELDIAGAMQVVDGMIQELENDLPQLTLSRLTGSMKGISGTAIENLAADGVDIIEDLQSTYKSGLTSATKMALSIASFRRYPQFRGYNLNSYESGALDFEIKARPIFKDSLSVKEVIELTLQAANSSAAKLVLPKLGYSDEEIQELENAKADESAAAIRGMFEGTFGNADKQQQEREKRLADENPVQDKAKAEEYA
jgi:hypothetical protein